MALMDKHKQVKRQRLDRICEGEISEILAHKAKVNMLINLCTWGMFQTSVFEHSANFPVCFPCPNFVKCRWHQIQYKHAFTKVNEVDDVKY